MPRDQDRVPERSLPSSQASDRRSSSLPGALAAVLGVLAVLTAWVPVLGLVSTPAAAVAIALGAVGLQRRRAGRAAAAVGLVAGVVALGMWFVLTRCLGGDGCPGN